MGLFELQDIAGLNIRAFAAEDARVSQPAPLLLRLAAAGASLTSASLPG